MDNVFIAWSGNKELAKELAKIINSTNKINAIVGGGQPKDMFVGEQVLNQIGRCDSAILLVEDKDQDGQISPNLMFEWGYIIAKMQSKSIYTVLINKLARDLPSDLQGVWVSELSVDRSVESDEDIAKRIYKLYNENMIAEGIIDYFDLINNWPKVFLQISENDFLSTEDMCECMLSGCLAAYYYTDNHKLRRALDRLPGSSDVSVNNIIFFGKTYVDIFLNSLNMTTGLSNDQFFQSVQNVELLLSRQRVFSDELEHFFDMLCHNIYGLSCMLYLKNEGLDEATIQYCADQAYKILYKFQQMIDEFEKMTPKNVCLIQLLRAYVYNDLAHVFKLHLGDDEKYMEYLGKSVTERRNLHQTFAAHYPTNLFLSTKLEQEYVIALSEQCRDMEDSFMKKMTQNTIVAKYKEWEKDLIFTESLTSRIRNNIEDLL